MKALIIAFVTLLFASATMAQSLTKEERKAAIKYIVKITDEEIKKMVTDRTNKVKTAEPFEPQNTGFKSYDEAVAAFKSKRAMLVDLVKNSDADMRNHIVTLPFGKMDAYQFILFIAGHSNRHTQQLNEVKTATGYPQS
ncbi:MAG: DinB family protein [Saprospiraceae bacterium]|nr:DinB family protein [Saprospiraceae bacterium]